MLTWYRNAIKRLHPTQMIALSFLLVITAGTMLLSLPVAVHKGHELRFIDAFFTAVSATCVTGLATIDTSATFTFFGQMVILACIQVGGLGLMAFTTIFLIAVGRRLSIADRVAIQESFHHTPTGSLKSLIWYLVAATFTIEGLGAAALTVHWWSTDQFPSLAQTVYHAVFHSVSSYCNAGFSLYSDSLVRYHDDPVVVCIISILVILGGLGFLVGLDLKEFVQQKFFMRLMTQRAQQRVQNIQPRPRLSLHSKLVLINTIILLVVGTISFYLLERNGLFREMSEGSAWLNAWFCSVTPRTAGFNAIDYGRMSGGALLCTMVLMFIGANPGSTGGGVKTSTFGLLIAYGYSRWRGYSRLHIFKRTLPQESIDRAAGVVIAAIALVILGVSVLMVTETLGSADDVSRARLPELLFETISAFATVGLSTGQTPMLSMAGKLIVCALMFMGRIGPITLALAVSARREKAQYRYAEENVMVG